MKPLTSAFGPLLLCSCLLVNEAGVAIGAAPVRLSEGEAAPKAEGVKKARFELMPSIEVFGDYHQFPPLEGPVIYKDHDRVTVSIRRDELFWDGQIWTASPQNLPVTVEGNKWFYRGALPQEDGAYIITVLSHRKEENGQSHGSGMIVQIQMNRNGTAPPSSNPSALRFNRASRTLLKSVNAPVTSRYADFNEDGYLDLAATTSVGVAVFLGDGVGKLEQVGVFPAGDSPRSIAIADFNSDDTLDLAVSNGRSNDVSLLVGDGKGYFVQNGKFPVGNEPLTLAPVYFDGDKHADLIVANYGTNVEPDTISVLLGDGKGGFTSDDVIEVGEGPAYVTSADIVGGRNQDLIAANTHSQSLSIFAMEPTGIKREPITVKTGTDPQCIAFADFNNDRRMDFITTNGHRWGKEPASITLGISQPEREFSLSTYPLEGVRPQFVETGDFNGDGNMDFVVSDAPQHRLIFVCGKGKGGFEEPLIIPCGKNPSALSVADFNGDNKLDVAVVTFEGIDMMINGS